MSSYTGMIVRTEHVRNSQSGNPTYRVTFRNGDDFLTEQDGAVAYEIDNYVGQLVTVDLNRARRIVAVRLEIAVSATRSPNALPASSDTTDDYPTRCPDCSSPVHWLAVFPRGRCLDCHARVTPPITDARQLARMWGAQT